MSYHFRPILAYFTVRGTTLSYFFGRVVPARFVEPTGTGDRPRGDLALPIVRIETSQKAQRGVHLVDLAAYIDKRRAAAVKECCQLTGRQEYEFGTSKQTKGFAKA
jgi:pyocin activator protein PrtN